MFSLSQSNDPEAIQKSAFGEILVAQPDPVVATGFTYSINPDLFISRTNNGATITQSGVSAHVKTTIATNCSAQLLSRRTLRYNPGQGSMCRFAGPFSAPAAGSFQYVGYGSVNDAFLFGYNGTTFGVMRRYGGQSETRTLTITTKSSTAENITVTLDGVAVTVAVTNGANTTVTANEVAAGDYSNAGSGWEATAYGSSVVFRSYASGPLAGTYSVAGTTVVGTFARTVTGVAATESFIAQTDWNGDKADGTKILPSVFSPQVGNVYQIRFQWLGYGLISFYMENPDDGRLILVHKIKYANTSTSPSINNPTLPFLIQCGNTTNNTVVGPQISSIGLYHEGPNDIRGISRAISATKTGITTETPVMTVRNKGTFASKLNRIVCDMHSFTVAVDGTKSAVINIYKNATIVGASFTDISTTKSPVSYDTSATSVSGGELVHSRAIAKVDNVEIMHPHNFIHPMNPNDQYTLTISSSSATDAVVSMEWEELF